MFKKTMRFEDLDGNEASQTFYFNYNKKEVGELLEFGFISAFPPSDGRRRLPLEKQLELLGVDRSESGLSNQENNQQAYDIFQDLILNAYGEKADDNVRFIKNARTREYMQSHVAFPEIIFEFLENPQLAIEFIENCLPQKLVANAKAELEKDAGRKLEGTTLADMVAEAERRQQDPTTRIEPGAEAAREALGPNPVIEELANAIAEEPQVKAKEPGDLTPEDIEQMDDIAFRKLDVRGLRPETLQAAFRRKNI